MTKAPIVTRAINEAASSSDLRSYSFVERRQAIRSAIVAARPVLPDDHLDIVKVVGALGKNG